MLLRILSEFIYGLSNIHWRIWRSPLVFTAVIQLSDLTKCRNHRLVCIIHFVFTNNCDCLLTSLCKVIDHSLDSKSLPVWYSCILVFYFEEYVF